MCVCVSQQFDSFAGAAAQVFVQSALMLQAPQPPPVDELAVTAAVFVVCPPLVDDGAVVTAPVPPAPPMPVSLDAQATKRAGANAATTTKVRTFFTVLP